MQAENADSAGLTRFPIRPATFARSAWASAGPKRNVRTIYRQTDRQTGGTLSSLVGARSRSPQLYILVECLALWGERERSRRQYRSQVSVFKPALFTEHSNTDKMKKRRTVADSVANIGESGDRDRCLGTSVAHLGVNTRP